MTPRLDLLRAAPAAQHFAERWPDEVEEDLLDGPVYARHFLRKTSAKVPCRIVVTRRECKPVPADPNPVVDEINKTMFCVPDWNRRGLAIFQIEAGPDLEHKYVFAQTKAFVRERYNETLAPDGKTPLGDWWLQHPHRRTYQRILAYPLVNP